PAVDRRGPTYRPVPRGSLVRARNVGHARVEDAFAGQTQRGDSRPWGSTSSAGLRFVVVLQVTADPARATPTPGDTTIRSSTRLCWSWLVVRGSWWGQRRYPIQAH